MAELDQLSQKFNKLAIKVRERPVLPKGKRSAYNFFMQHMNKVVKEKQQPFNSLMDLSKYCSKKWKEMTKTEKIDFEKLSEKDGKRFAKELAQYEKQKELYDKFVDEVHDKGLIHDLAVKQNHSFATNSRPLTKRVEARDDLRSNEHKAVVGNSSQSDNSEVEEEEEESDEVVFHGMRNIKKKEKNNNMKKSAEEEEEDFDEENVSADDGEGSDGSEGESGVDDEEQSGGSDEEQSEHTGGEDSDLLDDDLLNTTEEYNQKK